MTRCLESRQRVLRRHEAQPGRHRLQCRAHAADGSVQPLEAEWNTAGMGNHSVQTVDVTVRAP